MKQTHEIEECTKITKFELKLLNINLLHITITHYNNGLGNNLFC